MKENALLYQLALVQIPGIGGVTARRLIAYCGGAAQVFRERTEALKRIPGVGGHIAGAIRKKACFDRAEREIAFMRKHGIRALYYQDDAYPFRLKECEDGPILIFVKGEANLNHPRVLAVIGSRNITQYGREECERLIEELIPYDVTVLSGLAYGVDACAHRAALKHGMPTLAVLGHGLDRIYPPLHQGLARDMLGSGALITDFMTGTKPERENFPKRNRIIAGLCDAIVVVEAALTGGALITANIANTYNRDVFAIPGRLTDRYSQGCNKLIRIHKAHLLEKANDLEYIMNWTPGDCPSGGRQAKLFVSLTPDEKQLLAFLQEHPDAGIDHIVAGSGLNLGKASSLLLGLEFKGVVKVLPGKHFRLSGSL